MKKKAVVLVSGGIDSTTTLAIAQNQNFETYALTFQYGQRHSIEIESSRRIGEYFNVKDHLFLEIDLRKIGGSALTGDIPVPKNKFQENEIPITYVPARNTIFLSFALAWAETLQSNDIFIGVNALDYSGYPDCRPEYIQAYEKMANLATKAGVSNSQPLTIHTPLIQLSKGDIIKRGMELGVDYSLTHSCYDPQPGGLACGQCDSCVLRLKGFKQAGYQDPVPYAS